MLRGRVRLRKSRYRWPWSRLSPAKARELYNPDEEQLGEVYLMERLGTKQGWSNPAPDESFMFGYPQEIQDFIEAVALDREPQAGAVPAGDVVGDF